MEQAGVAGVLSLDKIRAYFDHPGFVGPFADATVAAFEELDEGVRERAELVFVTHSVPLSYSETSDYVPQHEAVAQLVADRVAEYSDAPSSRGSWSTAAAADRRRSRGWSRTSAIICASARGTVPAP